MKFIKIVGSFVLFFSLISIGYAAPGDPDISFDGDGAVLTDFTTLVPGAWGELNRRTGIDVVSAVAVQSDGKILAAGYSSDFLISQNGLDLYPLHLTIARYNTDGSLDSSFAGGVVVIREVSVYQTMQHQADIAIRQDGNIFVLGKAAGTVDSNGVRENFLLVQLDSAGNRIPYFGWHGLVSTAFEDAGPVLSIQRVFIQSDGKIVAVGTDGGYADPGDPRRTLIARYLTNGGLDPSYGTGGKLAITYGDYREPNNSQNQEYVLPVMQVDDRLVLLGFYRDVVTGFTTSGMDWRYYSIRYRLRAEDGRLDTSYGHDGKVITDVPIFPDRRYHGATIDSEGNIYGVGYALTSSRSDGFDLLIDKYDRNGFADTAFADHGTLISNTAGISHTTQMGGQTIEFHYQVLGADIAVARDGQIIAMANLFGGEDRKRVFLLKLNPDGTRDTSFGINGQTITFGPPSVPVVMYSLALAPDCKIVVGGADDVRLTTDKRFIVARYLNTCRSNYEPFIYPPVVYRPWQPDKIPPDPKVLEQKKVVNPDALQPQQEKSIWNKVIDYLK